MAKLFARLWILTSGLIVGSSALAADGPHTALESFTGAWEGELRVFALDGFLLKTFPAHRSYNWSGGSQIVVMRFFDGDSDYETQTTQLVDGGRLTASVARPGQPPEEYTGALEAGAVVWTNSSNNKRDYSERLVTTNGVIRLETTSSEIMRVKGVSGVVRVTGSFQRTAAAPLPGAAPASAGAPTPNERIAALERELADTRQAAATAAQSSAAAQSELTYEGAALRVRIAKLETERAGLANRAATASGAIARFVELEQSADAARRATEVAQNAAITAAGQTAAMRERVAALETRLGETEAALATARSGATESSGQKQLLAQRDAELVEVRATLAKLQDELGTARTTRAQQEKANAVASQARDANRSETARLTARIAELEAAVAAAEQARATTAAANGDIERERTELRQQTAGLVSAAKSAEAELTKLRAERETLAARVATLETRPDISVDTLAAEQRHVEERLAQAESATLDFTARLADAEKRLEVTRADIARTDAAAAGLEDLQRTLATAQADTTAARRQVELLQGERDLLTSRLQGADGALAERQSALQAAEARLQQLATVDAATAGLHAELESQRTRTTEREQENVRLTTRLAELEREQATLLERITGLEQAAKPASADTAAPSFTLAPAPTPVPTSTPAVPSGSREELRVELTRLQRRVTELESERNSIRNKQTLLQGQLDQMRQLRDDTLARFQDVVAQLNAMREERDRLARTTVSLEAEVRTLRGPNAAAANTPAPEAGTSPGFLERLLGGSETPKPDVAPAAGTN